MVVRRVTYQMTRLELCLNSQREVSGQRGGAAECRMRMNLGQTDPGTIQDKRKEGTGRERKLLREKRMKRVKKRIMEYISINSHKGTSADLKMSWQNVLAK